MKTKNEFPYKKLNQRGLRSTYSAMNLYAYKPNFINEGFSKSKRFQILVLVFLVPLFMLKISCFYDVYTFEIDKLDIKPKVLNIIYKENIIYTYIYANGLSTLKQWSCLILI